MRIRFLGTGDAFGSGGRFQACIYAESGSVRFLLDCGASSLIAMKRFGIEPNDIDAILISHLHGDHFGGIPFLILDAQFSYRTKPLVIAGPPGIEARVRQTMEDLFLGSSSTEQRFSYGFVDIAARAPADVLGLEVTAYPVPHSGGSTPYAYRVEHDGKVLAYSGDTEWTPALIDVSRRAGLFICEANFFDKQVRNHVSYRALLEHRKDFDCERLILTHLGPEALARRDEIEFEIADDGLSLEF